MCALQGSAPLSPLRAGGDLRGSAAAKWRVRQRAAYRVSGGGLQGCPARVSDGAAVACSERAPRFAVSGDLVATRGGGASVRRLAATVGDVAVRLVDESVDHADVELDGRKRYRPDSRTERRRWDPGSHRRGAHAPRPRLAAIEASRHHERTAPRGCGAPLPAAPRTAGRSARRAGLPRLSPAGGSNKAVFP